MYTIMEVFRIICLLIFLCIRATNLMSLKGTPFTLYNPCGLGDFYFYKITSTVWAGNINLASYKHTTFVEIELIFKHNITLRTLTQEYNAIPNTHYILRFNGHVPDRYKFYVTNDYGANDTSPELQQVKFNNQSLCKEPAEKNQTKINLEEFNYDENDLHVCGRRPTRHNEVISVMAEAKVGDWPWHVAIFIGPEVAKVAYQCGGNIISKTSILTAGHCVGRDGYTYDPNRIYVVAGFTNYTAQHIVGRQILTAEKVIIHPSFNDLYSTSDLAIVKVNKFRYTEYVQPICVWGPSYDKSALYGKRAMVVGFGLTEDDKYSKVLRASYTLVQYDSTCIGQLPEVYKSLLNEFTFCAGFGMELPELTGINPRNGDSGAGLVVPVLEEDHKVTWYLRGVLSKCGKLKNQANCAPELYVVYTDVGPHHGWIQHHFF